MINTYRKAIDIQRFPLEHRSKPCLFSSFISSAKLDPERLITGLLVLVMDQIPFSKLSRKRSVLAAGFKHQRLTFRVKFLN